MADYLLASRILTIAAHAEVRIAKVDYRPSGSSSRSATLSVSPAAAIANKVSPIRLSAMTLYRASLGKVSLVASNGVEDGGT